MEQTLSQLLEIAVRAARAGGAIAREGWGRTHNVTLKGAANPVTEVDHASEAAIMQVLSEATPAINILSEESGAVAAESRKAETSALRWVIDPLDGTVNYSLHLPYFSISVGLEQLDAPNTVPTSLVGAIYDPILDQLFTAVRGGGAYLNGRPIRCTKTPTVSDAVIASGFPYDVWETGTNLSEIVRVTRKARALRVLGCASLDMANVACGRLDAYFETGLWPWDIAAARLLVTEAGGRISIHGGDPAHTETQLHIVSSASIHDELQTLLRG